MDDTELARWSVIDAPWTPPDIAMSATTVGGRPCLLTDGNVAEVTADASRDALPLLGEWTDEKGRSWRCFELPDAGLKGDSGPTADVVELTLINRDGRRWTRNGEVSGALPRRADHSTEAVPEHDPAQERSSSSISQGAQPIDGSVWIAASEKAEELIGRHIDFINGLYDEAKPGGRHWEGDAQGVAIRPAARVIARWRKVGSVEEPRSALIVRLARELPELLTDLCVRPRHVLGRVRQLQPVGRVQEVDATCLRWLARQPGRHVAEKAGVSQRVMGIARVENIDTLENRVVRDLLRRASLACRRYLIEYGHFDHDRIRSVMRFRRLVRRLAGHTPIGHVRPLIGVPNPNYVLQHDPRYRIAWSAFLQLVRQETMLDNVWRWRQRIWAEDCGLAFLATLRDLSVRGVASGSDMLLHAEQVAGRFLDPRTAVAGWRLSGRADGSVVDLLDGRPEARHLYAHPFVPHGIGSLRPDHVALRRQVGPDGLFSVAGIWTILDFDLDRDRLAERAAAIARSLTQLPGAHLIRAVLIQPGLGPIGVDRPGGEVVEVGACRGVRLSLPLQGHVAELQDHLAWALRL